MTTNNLLTPAAVLLGSAAIAASIYANPSQQLAGEKLACASSDGVVRFDPKVGITENKLTDRCKKLLGLQLEAALNWPARLWLD